MAKKTYDVTIYDEDGERHQYLTVRAKNIIAAILKLVVKKGIEVDNVITVETED